MNSHIMLLISLVAVCHGFLLWGCRRLPKERWQFLAAIPQRKRNDGYWDSLNLTWYGFLTSFAFVAAALVMVFLLGSSRFPVYTGIIAFILLTPISLIASRVVAQWVEKQPGTHTVGGAVLVITALIVPTVGLANYLEVAWLGEAFGKRLSLENLIEVLAAIAISYVMGEGIGRVACISFGCCYGIRVDKLNGIQRRLFTKAHFVFLGRTKKISYASGLEGVAVVPIQAITAWIYMMTAVLCMGLFLLGNFRTALIVSMGVSQLWRFFSEFLRSDDRGAGRITAYQWMALATFGLTLAYCTLISLLIGPFNLPQEVPNIELGFQSLWSAGVILLCQMLGLFVFFSTGRSSVTRSRMAMYLVSDNEA